MYILCVSRNKYDEPIASRTEKMPNFDRLMKYSNAIRVFSLVSGFQKS